MLSMLGAVKVQVGKDDWRDYCGAGVKCEMVTAVECISGDGRALLPLIIWPASIHRSNWRTRPTPGWQLGCSENGYNTSRINIKWLMQVFDPQTKDRAKGRPRVLINDGFASHKTLEVLKFYFENNIILCRLPSHTSHKLQPCDVGVFSPLKTAYRDEVERFCRGGFETVSKEHCTALYATARNKAMITRNITTAWAASDLFPFNPDRVLRKMPKPPAEASMLDNVGPCGQESAAHVPTTPTTPVTPVTTDSVKSLHSMIRHHAGAWNDQQSSSHLQ